MASIQLTNINLPLVKFNSTMNIVDVPVDVIITVMKKLASGSFTDFFNFFKAWGQAHRSSTIVRLMEDIPLRDLYQYANSGTTEDMACFHRFFSIATELGVADAILFQRCKELFCGRGRSAEHFMVIDGLAGNGHFLSMVAAFSLKTQFQRQSILNMLEGMLRIYRHPHHQLRLAPALETISCIRTIACDSEIVGSVCAPVACPLHLMGVMGEECLFCHIAKLFNVVIAKQSRA